MSTNKPHILYILSDEHRGQAISHLGDLNVRTPNMDRMAREGTSFARAYANCPICTPSRGTIFSGRHAHCGPVGGFFDNFKATAPSTAWELRKLGYRTAYFGKWHMGTVRDQLHPLSPLSPKLGGATQRTPERYRGGFQDWYGFENLNRHFESFYYKNDEPQPTFLKSYETDGLTDLVLEYLESYTGDEPLFLVLSVTPPHFPLIVPEPWKRFDPAKLQVSENFEDTPELREHLANYYAMIENLDHNLGRLLEKLDALPRFKNNTLSVYFSDHGDYMGSHGLHNTKEHPHEESIRIPAIFHDPARIPAQGTVDGLFSLVDLQATVLGLIGAQKPVYDQGTDFSPLLRGESFKGPDEVLIEMEGTPHWHLHMRDWRGFVSKRWKYAYYETGEQMLYDLEADPCELKNLVKSNPEQARRCKARLLELLRETQDNYFGILIEHGMPLDRPDLDLGTDDLRHRYRHLNRALQDSMP